MGSRMKRAGPAAGPERRTVIVCHPEHGELAVKGATGTLDAVMVAAQKWDMQWSTLVREASFREERGEDGHKTHQL